MNSNLKYSIIVPNYNKEVYIEECINSILNQTYKNYEIIMIDDGSTDNSVEVINKFNIKPLKTNRLQAGGARNLGLEHATGDYIIFLDSDDYLSNNDVLEKLTKIIKDEDLIFLNYSKNTYGDIKEVIEEKEDISLKIETTKQLGCPTKCFKRSLLEGIYFPECKRYEDIIFTLEAMCKAETYTYFEESFFTYRKVANSNVTSEIKEDVMIDIMEELFKIYKLCLKYPKYKLNLLNRIKNDKLSLRLDILNELIETGNNKFKEYFQ